MSQCAKADDAAEENCSGNFLFPSVLPAHSYTRSQAEGILLNQGYSDSFTLEAKFNVSIAQTAKIFKSATSIFSLFLTYKEHTQATIVHVL